MRKLLPLGSVVGLHDGNQKLMIISRYQLFKLKDEIGYFDYSACLYPVGQTAKQTYYFNQKDIEKVFFRGFEDELEDYIQQLFNSEDGKIPYRQLSVEETKELISK